MNELKTSEYRYKELFPLFEYLSKCNISYSVIKGEPLSVAAYGAPGKRGVSNDIDLLIPRNSVEKIKEALVSMGFELENTNRLHYITALASTHQSIPYRKKLNSGTIVEVDINHDIFWGEYTGKRISMDEFLNDAVNMSIYGCDVKTLPPLKAIIQLILHHYNEFNCIYHLFLGYCINYSMLKDIYCLWARNKEAISQNLYEISCKYEIVPYVYYILYYTNLIFSNVELEKLLKSFETSEGKALLHCYGLTDAERKIWNVDFFARLNEENVFKFIKRDLTKADIEKLERAKEIFG